MKKKTASTVAKNVDEYLACVPKKARATLEKLRKTIKAAAPMASEVISYQMPTYKHHGMVAGFAAFKDHCSLFPGSAVMNAHKEELKCYDTSKGTIRFPANEPLPATLVKKLVKARIEENSMKRSLKPERIVYDHVSGPKFHVAATFAEVRDKTRITFCMLFETR